MALKVFDTLAPQGEYPAVKAKDVEMPDGTRLSKLPDYMPVAITQADYDKLVAEGKVNENTPYLIVEGGNK